MIRGANIILDVHVVVVVVVFLQQVRVRLQSVFQLLCVLVVQFTLAGVIPRSLHLSGCLPFILRFSQLFLVLHPPILKPRFYLRGVK